MERVSKIQKARVYTHTCVNIQRGSSQTVCRGTLSRALQGLLEANTVTRSICWTLWSFAVLRLDCVTFLLIVSYLCIAGALAIAMIKSKRTIRKVNQKTRVAGSNLISGFEKLCSMHGHIRPISKYCVV